MIRRKGFVHRKKQPVINTHLIVNAVVLNPEEKNFFLLEEEILSQFPIEYQVILSNRRALKKIIQTLLVNLYFCNYIFNKMLRVPRGPRHYTRAPDNINPGVFTQKNVVFTVNQLINFGYVYRSKIKNYENCIYPTPKLFERFKKMEIDKYDFFDMLSRDREMIDPVIIKAIIERFPA